MTDFAFFSLSLRALLENKPSYPSIWNNFFHIISVISKIISKNFQLILGQLLLMIFLTIENCKIN